MKELLKYGLIAGGALFLFKDQLAGLFGTPATATAGPAPGSAYYPPQTAIPAIYTQPQYTAPPAAAPQPAAIAQVVPITEDLRNKASWDYNTAVILGDRLRHNIHEWNWFREHSGGGRTNPGTAFEEYADPNVPITALQYIDICRRAGFGLSGIRR